MVCAFCTLQWVLILPPTCAFELLNALLQVVSTLLNDTVFKSFFVSFQKPTLNLRVGIVHTVGQGSIFRKDDWLTRTIELLWMNAVALGKHNLIFGSIHSISI